MHLGMARDEVITTRMGGGGLSLFKEAESSNDIEVEVGWTILRWRRDR